MCERSIHQRSFAPLAILPSERSRRQREHMSGAPTQRSTLEETGNNRGRYTPERQRSTAVPCACHASRKRKQQALGYDGHPQKGETLSPPSTVAPFQRGRCVLLSHLPCRERCVFVTTQCEARHRHSVARFWPIRLESPANLLRKYGIPGKHETNNETNKRKKY